ncbi:MAG: hydroxymethylglutaryl-CoA synthase [Candidatus Micrarchaeota archaeon]|nr:MAG: hydroxymethylglutaryl-CoA synthase [Candidatus Micrarchaeota archaeon]
MSSYGVNDIAIGLPSLYIKPENIARAVNKRKGVENLEEAVKNDTQKIVNGLGINEIRVPSFSESNLTFTADAIYELIKHIADSHIDKLLKEPINTIYYSSESNPDRSRPELESALLIVISKLYDDSNPYADKIAEMLRKSAIVPITFACAGGGIALIEAVSKIRALDTMNKKESAIVITADTAVYEDYKAPNAEYTQGAGAVALWVTKDPELFEVDMNYGEGSFNMPLADFTKFGDEIPVVHGKFSERIYVYSMGKALEELERDNKKEISFFVTHVPFPKQAIYFASFLFAHRLRENESLLKILTSRAEVGEEPIKERFTALMDRKFKSSNIRSTSERSFIEYIENDNEINSYWEWLKRLRNTQEFKAFVEKLSINDALKLPSVIGNSYSSSALIALSSLLLNKDLKGRSGLLGFYGSGAIAKVFSINVLADLNTAKQHIVIKDKDKVEINDMQYEIIHRELVRGDAKRTITDTNLVKKDLAFLNLKSLPEGFRIIRRYEDGTGEFAYSYKDSIKELYVHY